MMIKKSWSNTLRIGLGLFLLTIFLTLISGYFGTTVSTAALPSKLVLNQVGYGTDWQKQAFLINSFKVPLPRVEVTHRQTGQTVLTVSPRRIARSDFSGNHLQTVDFSQLKTSGEYFLKAGTLESVPFTIAQNPYQEAQTKLLHSYYLQRCGVEIRDAVTGIRHAPCHIKDGAIAHGDKAHSKGQIINAAGGWHDAGDYGKYVSTTTVSIGRLLSLYEQFPTQLKDRLLTIPESGNNIPDLLDEMQVGLDWLLTMQRPDGAIYRKLSGRQWPLSLAPNDDQQPRFVYGISTPETAKFAAVMAIASRVYQPILPEQAKLYQSAAINAWRYLEYHPNMQVDWVDGDDSGSGKYLYSEIDNEESLKTDTDDRLWAAAELWITLGQSQFEQYFAKYLQINDYTLFEWKDPSALGLLDYLLQSGSRGRKELKVDIQTKLLARADRLLEKVKESPYHLANDRFIWGSNKMAAEEGITLAYAYQLTHDRRYLNAAREQLHFLLGRNPFNQTFVTGVGTNPVRHINHLFARTMKMDIPGLLVGGPNNSAQDGIAPKNQGIFSYIDNEKSYATNEYAIDYNASLITLIEMVTAAVAR